MKPGQISHRLLQPDPGPTALSDSLDTLIALSDTWTASWQEGPGARAFFRVLTSDRGGVVLHRDDGDLALGPESVALLTPGWTYRSRTIATQWCCHALLLAGPWADRLAARVVPSAGAMVAVVPELRRALADAVEAVLSAGPAWDWTVVEVLGRLGARIATRGDPVTLANRVARLLDEHPDRPWRVGDLADALAMGLSTFAHRFRAETGASPAAWVRRHRVDQAKALLASRPVKEVATALGFADRYHFSRVFRRIAGMPPAAWRRRVMAVVP